jgi:hypothetical protein
MLIARLATTLAGARKDKDAEPCLEEKLGFKVELDPVSPYDRAVSMKSGKNCRVFLNNPLGTGPLRCESWFEAQCAIYLMSRRDVVDVSCQYEVEYAPGKFHYFDFRVTYKSGLIRLLAARPARLDRHGKLAEKLELIRNYSLRQHADKCGIMTDELVTKAVFLRSAEILRARSLKNQENCNRMQSLLSRMNEVIKVSDLLQEFGNVGAARTAMWNLIDEGVLAHACSRPDRTKMTDVSFLRQCA